MFAIQKALIDFGNMERECVILLDPKVFHLAFMSKSRFKELFGEKWETGATTRVVLGIKHEVDINSYAIVNIKIQNRVLKNVYVWLIDEDINNILPPQYREQIDTPIDLVLGSTILENFGIKLVRDEKSGSTKIIL